MFSEVSVELLWDRCSKGTNKVNISVGQSINISLTHMRQISRNSAGTYELHNVKSRVVISPISFHLDSKCLQSLLGGLLLDVSDVFPAFGAEMAGLKKNKDFHEKKIQLQLAITSKSKWFFNLPSINLGPYLIKS